MGVMAGHGCEGEALLSLWWMAELKVEAPGELTERDNLTTATLVKPFLKRARALQTDLNDVK